MPLPLIHHASDDHDAAAPADGGARAARQVSDRAEPEPRRRHVTSLPG
jgi:hypothetical protein